MKKLSLLIFATLIPGCATETPVVEEPEPVIVEPPPVKPFDHPLIVHGTVTPREVNVDPEPLNRHGLRFELTKNFYSSYIELRDKDGKPLRWGFPSDQRWEKHVLFIQRMSDDDSLESDTEYEILISVQDFNCRHTDIVIQFRTKPQRPVVGRLEPAIQERIPAVALGERFWIDPVPPDLVAGDVLDGEDNVDPEPLNENGIQFEFNEGIKSYKIDLRLHEGASLGWLPRGLVNNDMGPRIRITPAEGAPLLEFDTAYEIEIFVEDHACLHTEFTIVFRTKPKP